MTTISGDDLLNDTYKAIKRFCVLPSEHEYVAVTLWCAYTHFSDVFHYAPRLIARSPHKRSGKTRLLEVTSELVRGALRSVNMTSASVFRLLDQNPNQTLILDEVDALFGTRVQAAQNEDLRALLNAGFQRGNPVWRVVGPNNTPTPFQAFAPVAMAGIGKLPDTIEDRSIVIPMRRKAPGEKVEPYRPSRDAPDLRIIRDQLAAWAKLAGDEAELHAHEQRVDLPVDDRAADLWEPLLIVAELAGADWPRAGRAACRAIADRSDDDDTTPGQLLLADIHGCLRDVDFMSSKDLVARLHLLSESPWSDERLSTHGLAHILDGYGIKPRHSSDKSRRGYHTRDFADAWSRYLPEKPSKASEPSQQRADQYKPRDMSSDAQVSPDVSEVSATAELSRQTRRSTPRADTSDTSDGLSESCPECGRPLTPQGKCGACIVARLNAAAKTTIHEEIAS